MTFKIALRLQGLDLREVEAYDRLPAELGDLSFEANGPVSLAVVYSEATDPASEVLEWARMISKHAPGVAAVEVHDELVATADIAARCGVGVEAVRLWSTGRRRVASRPFPTPKDVVSLGVNGRSMNLYRWADVVDWVRNTLGVDPDEGITYLDSRRLAHLNSELADMAANFFDHAPRVGESWHYLPIRAVVTATQRLRSIERQSCWAEGYTILMAQADELLLERPAARKAQLVPSDR